jgi:pyruvate dehydrogenase E2 component (dihydrolipoamide acetyltransferase)
MMCLLSLTLLSSQTVRGFFRSLLGEQGVESVFGVIYPPQVALVGFGKIVERPWAINGLLGARPIIMASLAADHRASDGHRGALFLAAINRLLQEPQKL